MRVSAIGYENRRDIIPHCGKVKCPNGPCVDEPLGYMYPCKRETKRITIDLDQKLLEERIQMCHRALKTYTNKYQKDVIREKNKVETYTITAFGNNKPLAPTKTFSQLPQETRPCSIGLKNKHPIIPSRILPCAQTNMLSLLLLSWITPQFSL